MSNRALVIVGPDGIVQVVRTWPPIPGELPGVNLIFDGLAAA